MKKIAFLVAFAVLTIVSICFSADPATAPIAASPAPSMLAWVMANTTAIFGVALAISEFMSLIPGFQGNGILDTIIKALTTLSKKPE